MLLPLLLIKTQRTWKDLRGPIVY